MRKILFYIALITIVASCSGPVKDYKYNKPARPLPGKEARKLLNGAANHLGEPYSYGGMSSKGWDCSGFVFGMYNRYLGINIPRSTKSLFSSSIRIKRKDSRPGDLVFFKIKTKKPSHVGIYIGKNKFIHASTSNGVTVSYLTEKYYAKYFTGFRRLRFGMLAYGR